MRSIRRAGLLRRLVFAASLGCWAGCSDQAPVQTSDGSADSTVTDMFVPDGPAPDAHAADLQVDVVADLLFCSTADLGCGSTSSSVVGVIGSAEIAEASGIAVAQNTPGLIWVHNDSANPAEVFGIDLVGTLRAKINFNGVTNVDWEDIAVGPGPIAGKSYIYIGDIGDNFKIRANVNVLRFEEPTLALSPSQVTTVTIDSSAIDLIKLKYPGGPADAESLAVHPQSGALYIVTKDSDAGVSQLLRFDNQGVPATVATMDLIATLQFGTAALPGDIRTTAADFDPAGDMLVVRTLDHAFIWRWNPCDPSQAWARSACSYPLQAEPQGEAIAVDGTGFFTVSEMTNQPLYYYAFGP